MKYAKLIGFSACMLIFTSCDKFLDVNPTTYIISTDKYYTTEEQLETALRGVYATLADDGLYANYMLGRMGLEADEGFGAYSPDRGGVGYYTVSQADVKVLTYWKALYSGINLANLLLVNIDNPEMSDTKKNEIKGQALFLRAYYYFMLVNKFGDVPLVLDPTTSANVSDLQVPRTSIRTVYEKIIEDMTTAEGLVAGIESVESSGRVCKSVVQGILARVCLHMAGRPLNDISKYADAASWANKVIISGKHELNPSFEQVFINYARNEYDKKESIWEVEFWGNGQGVYSTTGGMVGRNNGIVNTLDDNVGYSLGVINATTWLYQLYGPTDKRRDWSIAPYYFSGNPAQKVYWASSGTIFQRDCGKYRREYETLTPKSQTRTPMNFPLLRYSDVLLMYAEAVNEQNGAPTTEAYLAINQVRRRGSGLPIDQSSSVADLSNLSHTDFKNEIMDERARELCFEALRKNDLIRWGIFHSRMKTILLEVPSGTTVYATSALQIYTNASPRDTIWPIPAYELGVNKNLVQNLGW